MAKKEVAEGFDNQEAQEFVCSYGSSAERLYREPKR